MKTNATDVKTYLAQLPDDRREVVDKLRTVLKKNLPKGFEEQFSYGMIGYVVPHTVYPPGYHVNPKLPLPFINIASQKNNISFYHMGIYAMPDLLTWFKGEWPKHTKEKLDMGKSCIRMKKLDLLPYKLFGQLAEKVSSRDWIAVYERNRPKQ